MSLTYRLKDEKEKNCSKHLVGGAEILPEAKQILIGTLSELS